MQRHEFCLWLCNTFSACVFVLLNIRICHLSHRTNCTAKSRPIGTLIRLENVESSVKDRILFNYEIF